jgi:hypothetical protein
MVQQIELIGNVRNTSMCKIFVVKAEWKRHIETSESRCKSKKKKKKLTLSL